MNQEMIRLPKLISDGMILQRNAKIKIWGWSQPGNKISVHFLLQKNECLTGADGKWMTEIAAGEAGGPYEMKIECNSEIISIGNIMTGDVWLCSGQSNMVLNLTRTREIYAKEIDASANPCIRQFLVPDRYDFCKANDDLLSGSWQEANPENVLQFSTVAFFFAKTVYKQYQVPIGLITACVGGSPIESWMSEESLKKFPAYLTIAEKYRDSKILEDTLQNIQESNDHWYHQIDHHDPGISQEQKSWYDPEFTDDEWEVIDLPESFAAAGLEKFNGVVWFRKDFSLSYEVAGKKAKLYLGRIVDSDQVYVNGKLVGKITYQYPPRIYEIPEDLLLDGKNNITIRVIANKGRGAFIKDKPYKLVIGDQIIQLAGIWKFKPGFACRPLPDTLMIMSQPLGLFNGMIAPLTDYPVKGVLWYQGESNLSRPFEYKTAFTELVADWRLKWNHSDLPFLYVQLPNYDEENNTDSWAIMRNEQLKCLDIPQTGMAVTIDLGEWNDLHPLRKKEIGERLAYAARKIAYKDNQSELLSPIYKSIKIMDNKIIVYFDNTGRGLTTTNGQQSGGFEVAGSDGIYLPAVAELRGNTVVVRNSSLKNPVSVRYAWDNNPPGANLCNYGRLPAAPFCSE